MPTTEAYDKLLKKMKKEYIGKKVPDKYKEKYGTMYNKKDVVSFSIATAKAKGIPMEKKEIKKNRWYE